MAVDLNVMMREQAKSGLQMQLDKAVTDGDTAAARKAAADLAALELAMAPKASAFTDADVYAQLDTQAPWYGVDPKKSAKAADFGKSMNPKKFPTAAAFAEAIVKAVDAEFATTAPKTDDSDGGESEESDDTGTGGAAEGGDKTVKPKRRTDAPGENDALSRSPGRSAGPWTKLSDAPAAIQAEIKRSADKLAPNASKENREAFVGKALEAHYAAHQRNKAKK